MEKEELFQVIGKAKRGDPLAFEQLVNEYKGHVFRQAMATVNDRMEAEDITQEAFIKAYYSIKKLDQEYAFVSWLTRIVSNLCYDKIKAKAREREKQKGIYDQTVRATPSVHIDQTHTRLTIEEALQGLSMEHKEAIILRDVQGFSYKEISDSLNIPLGTVKSRINIARQELKQILSEGEE